MSANTLEEFLNENLHRNYPILDSGDARDLTGSYNLPTEMIADISLTVPDGAIDGGIFFISTVVVRRYTIDVEISYKPDLDNAIILGWFHNMDTSADAFINYPFIAIPQTNPDYAEYGDIVGTMIAGKGLAATTLPGTWSFDENNTPLVPTAMDEQLTKFRSLQIGDEVFTGNIILKEGDNVTLSADYDPVTNTTTITITAQEVESSNITINNDAQLLVALTNLYGTPVTTINGIEPSAGGNFNLLGADCVSIETGEDNVQFTNPCSVPCCDRESYLTPVYDSLNQLNSRHVRLEDFLKDIVANSDTLLSRMKDLENSVGLGGF